MSLSSSPASSRLPRSPLESGSQSRSVSTHFEPYQSVAFQQMRARMQTLLTPPERPPSAASKPLTLASVLSSSQPSTSRITTHRHDSLTPSPPASEASCRDFAAHSSQTPLTEASDSSAESYTERTTRRPSVTRLSRKSPSVGHPSGHSRPRLAKKRVLSEGDVILPSRAGVSHAAARGPSVTSWRMAHMQMRQRRLAKRSSVLAATNPASSAHACAYQAKLQTAPKSDVLPELRLLSATRTAPIGWSQFAGASTFVPHMVEVYDERDANHAPEKQRFWPIIDHQLDYTGARMLSLSNTPTFSPSKTQPTCALNQPVSPKSSLPHASNNALVSIPPDPSGATVHILGSSDEDCSPRTPDASPRTCLHSSTVVSQHARNAVENESQRNPTISLSPASTLVAVIDYTRAQASHNQHHQQTPPHLNASTQPVHSSSNPETTTVKPSVVAPTQLEASASLRIAPRNHHPWPSANDRDYFGHWEAYLCNFGKESTF